jgi:hypothetical protein
MSELRSVSRDGLSIPMLLEPVAELPEEELTPEQRRWAQRSLERLESADQTEAILLEGRQER